MNNYFRISEFIIDEKLRAIPIHVVEKLLMFHLPELNKMRQELNAPLVISKRSGYRSRAWEIQMGRSGNSEHTFTGRGAVDITAKDFSKLINLAIKSEYTRVCIYPADNFIHCDFKVNEKKALYIDEGQGWDWVRAR